MNMNSHIHHTDMTDIHDVAGISPQLLLEVAIFISIDYVYSCCNLF